MAKAKPLPSLESLNRLYHYNPDTGVLMSKRKGSGISSLSSRGYLYACVDGSHYQVHRIAWYMHTGLDPLDKQIDHIDRDRTNNRFNNLRLATHQFNTKNTGAKGWIKVGNRYRAVIVHNRKQRHLGYFDTPDEARTAYLNARSELLKQLSND